ncbi:unnamed protein product, partial [Mesorhabditis spiculigera]
MVLTRAGRARAAAGHPTPPPPRTSSSGSSSHTPSPNQRTPPPDRNQYKQTVMRELNLMQGLAGQLLQDGPADTFLKSGDCVLGYTCEVANGRHVGPYTYTWSTAQPLNITVEHFLLMRGLETWERRNDARCCACHSKDLHYHVGLFAVCQRCGFAAMRWKGVNKRCNDHQVHKDNRRNIFEPLVYEGGDRCNECLLYRCILFGFKPLGRGFSVCITCTRGGPMTY